MCVFFFPDSRSWKKKTKNMSLESMILASQLSVWLRLSTTPTVLEVLYAQMQRVGCVLSRALVCFFLSNMAYFSKEQGWQDNAWEESYQYGEME